VIGWITSEFGYRVSPFTGKREFHKGIDIATEIGKEVVAPADGIVASVFKQRGLGNMVKNKPWKRCDNGLWTYVKKGYVKKGQKGKKRRCNRVCG